MQYTDQRAQATLASRRDMADVTFRSLPDAEYFAVTTPDGAVLPVYALGGVNEATARRRLYRLGADRYRDRLMLAWARAGRDSDPTPWRELAALPERWSVPKFPLKAADFNARGIADGPALGQVLKLAEDAWLAADFPLDEAALKTIADQTVSRFTRDIRL